MSSFSFLSLYDLRIFDNFFHKIVIILCFFCEGEYVENVEGKRSGKSVRFDDVVEKGTASKTMKNVTYSDVVRTNMSQIKHDKYVRM